jgi:hypothetical protein
MTQKVLWTPFRPSRNVLVIVAELVEVVGNFSPSYKQDSEESLEIGWSLRT